MPFGETLVDEHLNSNNSPFRFNAKELDEATGNYYYGARYYNPKWSTWLSVDPLAEEFPSWSPYNFTMNNPIRYVDPDGQAPLDIIDINKKTGQISITKAKGNDIVRLVDNNKVLKSYVYGNNGSFLSDNSEIVSNVDKGMTIFVSKKPKQADKFYRFAAESNVEFGIMDVKVNDQKISAFYSSHNPETESISRELVKEFSSSGFTGLRQSHSHPGDSPGAQVPSGYYGIEKGNPNSLTVFDKTDFDAGNANSVKEFSGFENTIFELFSPHNQTITTYDGQNQAKIKKVD
ncbi:MAG: RHS repeat-associated core domain-containing protein [Psychroflexus sp.]|nr:RHS repeat-associated core domain-containing protein [Psychroflexus sp.]